MPKKGKLRKMTKDGGSVEVELTEQEAEKYITEGNPDDEERSAFDPDDETEARVAQQFGGGSGLKFQLFRNGGYVADISEVEANPAQIKSVFVPKYGTGLYNILLTRSDGTTRNLYCPIADEKEEAAEDDIFAKFGQASKSGGSDTAQLIPMMFLMMNEGRKEEIERIKARSEENKAEMQYQIEKIRADADIRKAEMEKEEKRRDREAARQDARDKIVLDAVLNKKDSAMDIVGPLLNFLGSATEQLTRTIQPDTNPMLTKVIEALGPSVGGLMEKFGNRMQGAPQAQPQQFVNAPVALPNGASQTVGPTQGGNGSAVSPAEFLQIFEQQVLPTLFAAAKDAELDSEEGWIKNDPISFSETIASQMKHRFGISEELLPIVIVQFFGSLENFFARYPETQKNQRWFTELWNDLLGIETEPEPIEVITTTPEPAPAN